MSVKIFACVYLVGNSCDVRVRSFSVQKPEKKNLRARSVRAIMKFKIFRRVFVRIVTNWRERETNFKTPRADPTADSRGTPDRLFRFF